MWNSGLKDWSADLSPDETAWIPGNISPQLVSGSASSDRSLYFTSRPPAAGGGRRFTSQLVVDWNMWTSCTCLNEICTNECPGTSQARSPAELSAKETSTTFSCPFFRLSFYPWSWRSRFLLFLPLYCSSFPQSAWGAPRSVRLAANPWKVADWLCSPFECY